MITLIKIILIIAVVLAALYVLSTAGRAGHPGLEELAVPCFEVGILVVYLSTVLF